MKIVSFGSTYQIYKDDLKTYDLLPEGTYKIKFSPMSGFSLEHSYDFEQKEPKIYGNHERKISKVLNAFDIMNRSVGVILSGDKGIGKSLFTQLLSERAMEKGLPTIIVDRAYPGITDFIESIEQECLVLFDEFEKTFNEDGGEPQDRLLGLFDGTSQIKRIYAITVNKLSMVNEYMLNRPGRFHYHIRFEYPKNNEVREYLQDKVREEYHDEIEEVVLFANRVKLNYDCLRAIAFELDNGEKFKEAIKDLNIINVTDPIYNITCELYYKGKELCALDERIQVNTFSDKKTSVTFNPSNNGIEVVFAQLNLDKLVVELDGLKLLDKDVNIIDIHDEDYDYIDDEEVKNYQIKNVKIQIDYGNNGHYAF